MTEFAILNFVKSVVCKLMVPSFFKTSYKTCHLSVLLSTQVVQGWPLSVYYKQSYTSTYRIYRGYNPSYPFMFCHFIGGRNVTPFKTITPPCRFTKRDGSDQETTGCPPSFGAYPSEALLPQAWELVQKSTLYVISMTQVMSLGCE